MTKKIALIFAISFLLFIAALASAQTACLKNFNFDGGVAQLTKDTISNVPEQNLGATKKLVNAQDAIDQGAIPTASEAWYKPIMVTDAENPNVAINGVWRGTSFSQGGNPGFYDNLIKNGEESRLLQSRGAASFDAAVTNNADYSLKVGAFEHATEVKGTDPFLSTTTDVRVASATGGQEPWLVTEYAVPENKLINNNFGKPGERELLVGRQTKNDWIQNMYSYNPADKTYTLIGTRTSDGQLIALSDPKNIGGGSKVFDKGLGEFIEVPTPKEMGTKYIADPKTGELVPLGASNLQ